MMRNFFSREWTMAERVLAVSTAFLLGSVMGFLLSPIKKGIDIGDYVGDTTYLMDDEEE